jgi:Flp pilus assembly protein TadD
MFSSRNVHLAILGIILGASTAYVVAFYRVEPPEPPPLSSSEAESGTPSGHPEINNEQMLEGMKKAVETSPNDPEIIKRYAVALFEMGQLADAETWFGKAVALEPNSVDLRSMYGAVLWRMGKKDAATVQLEATLKLDPQNIPSLHGLTLLALEGRDVSRAAKLIQQIESIEPTYSQLPELRSRLLGLGDGK